MTGQEVRHLRRSWGMTQRELARVLGVSSQAKISQYENDRRPVPPTVRRLLGLMAKYEGRR
jgi:transcriptional regulator with XRE-family HTH domain